MNHSSHNPISLAWVLVSLCGGALAAAVVAGVAAGRAGLPVGGGLLLGAATLGALPQLVALLRRRWEPRWPELAAALLAFVAVAGLGLRLAWPSLLPLGLSVDAPHHYLLVRWIAERGSFPPTDAATVGRMGEMAAYPPGLALVVVAAARLTGLPPLEALYPTVALLGGLCAALVALLAATAADLRGGRAALLGGVGALILLAHRRYFLEAFIDHSYYAMVLGLLLMLLACGWLTAVPRLAAGQAFQVGLALAALAATYPLWLPIPVAFALLVLVRPDRLRALVPALLPPLLLALADLPQRLGTGAVVLAHEGLVARPDAAGLAPLLPALLAVPLLARGPRGRRLLGLAGLVLLGLVTLWLAGRYGLVASYHSYKLLFVLVPLAAALAAAGLARLADRAGSPLAPALAGTLLLALAAAAGGLAPPRPVQVLSPDLVAAARWLEQHEPQAADEALVVGAPAGPLAYWLQVGLLGQPRDRAATAQRAFTAPSETPEGWAIDTELPGLALAPDAADAPPGSLLAARFGGAAVLRRDPAADPQALDPLLIRYRSFWEDGRLKTALELLHPLPGRLPDLELRLDGLAGPVARFALPPEQERTRPQYLGADLLPATLAGEGYINTSAYPAFPAPAAAPIGPLTLTLALRLGGVTVDQRLLATFARGGDGQISGLAAHSGALVYLRDPRPADGLRAAGASYGGALRLEGWSGPGALAPGEPALITLRWRALAPLGRPLLIVTRLRDAAGQVVAESAAPPQGGFYPTWRWRPGPTVDDRRPIALPPDLPPGDYRLEVQVREPDGRPLAVTAGAAELGSLAVRRPPDSVARR
ncbi:MAG TPA: hypothetical protein VFS21_12155 [Roseiflexaceae bacterium]|nr:hypothetical protein [Roseiflexaceae bacterium]